MYLESEMLEEVCSAVGLVGLCSATSIDPDTHSRGLSPWRVFGRNLCYTSASHNSKMLPRLTVRPFDSVVLSVTAPWLTGVAKPREEGWMARRALLLLAAWGRLSASLLDAIERFESVEDG